MANARKQGTISNLIVLQSAKARFLFTGRTYGVRSEQDLGWCSRCHLALERSSRFVEDILGIIDRWQVGFIQTEPSMLSALYQAEMLQEPPRLPSYVTSVLQHRTSIQVADESILQIQE